MHTADTANIRVPVNDCKEAQGGHVWPAILPPICYLWRIVDYWFMLRSAFRGLPLYALQNTQRFRVWH
jgi:hypothetical protein